MEKTIEKIVEAPAVALDKGISASQKAFQTVKDSAHIQRPLKYWEDLGPGLTTGAADDDPSGVATYSQTGAQYGLQLIWLAPVTFPLMAIIQEMCARLGLVTGRGLAANIRKNYPRWVLYMCTFLLLFANTLNIGADLGAMARASQLLLPKWNFYALIFFFTFFSLGLQIYVPYQRYSKYLKYLALILLAYVFSALLTNLDYLELLRYSVIPSFSLGRDQVVLICGILGTTISPYLFFWQTSQEIEEEILKGKVTIEMRKGTTNSEIKKMRIDVWSGMFLSNLVMFFIIAACAGTLFKHGVTNIATAEQAALALKPLAGDYAYLLFALGIIGTGLLAVPVLAGSASYAITESFGWKFGLHKQLKQAYAFYGVIIFSMTVGVLINFIGLDSIKALIYSAIANGLVAPVMLVLIVAMSSSKKIMQDRVNHPLITAVGWFIAIVMALASIATIFTFFH